MQLGKPYKLFIIYRKDSTDLAMLSGNRPVMHSYALMQNYLHLKKLFTFISFILCKFFYSGATFPVCE